ncbi:hypothetical protein FNF31_07336 [Cafeteria roenbergensis]|uniref:SKI-interacting protein SKIP SNW domain-containing protein n=1 Tax=Cafeteria roenbergensis TaxID=33653 RepID=A0A5A8C885_CAFRO|nr:hypothetical protein FNF31_07336 [Cafeteria roenbergensis]
MAGSLASLLPRPTKLYDVYDDSGASSAVAALASAAHGPEPPPYGKRQGFRPSGPEDFGGGGAFPEIHSPQYPRNMGNPSGARRGKTIGVAVDAQSGAAAHDALVLRGGDNSGRRVFTRFEDVVERRGGVPLEPPSQEEVDETLARTQAALMAIVDKASAAGRGVQLPTQSRNRHNQSRFVRLTASEEAAGYNPDAKHRLVRVVEAPQDPLEPPKHKHKKAPAGPPEDPVPVQHAPAGKVSAADQQAWEIPPAISNWKNAHGFTIPLHVRMAADGRRLQETVTNERHAALTHDLDVAEALARKEVDARARLQQRLVLQEKEAKEAEMRELAARARLERTGIVPRAPVDTGAAAAAAAAAAGAAASAAAGAAASGPAGAAGAAPGAAVAGLGGADSGVFTGAAGAPAFAGGAAEAHGPADDGVSDRETMRAERKRQRERELRQEQSGKRARGPAGGRDDRDVSEKIALGMSAAPSLRGEAAFDTRLFAGGGGVGSGFGGDGDDNAYSAPWRTAAVSSIYRPRGDVGGAGDADAALAKLKGAAAKFTADVDFEGVGAGAGAGAAAAAARPAGAGLGSGGAGVAAPARDGPVEFVRAEGRPAGAGADGEADAGGDPFAAMGAGEARGGGRGLEGVGHGGGMRAAAGGGSGGGGSGRDAGRTLDDDFTTG